MNYRLQSYHSHNPYCHYCGVITNLLRDKGNWTQATLDHVIPKSKGGKSHDNLVLACKGCNTAKGSLSEQEFRLRLGLGTVPKRVKMKNAVIEPPDKYTNPAYWQH